MGQSIADALFSRIPLFYAPDAAIGQIGECGANIYLRRIENVEKEDYLHYLEVLETAGFEKYTETKENMRHLVSNAAFRKENQIVAVTYNGYWNRVYLTTYEEMGSYRQNKEELMKKVPIVNDATDYGGGNYVAVFENAKNSDYKEYLKVLEGAGFTRYIDNDAGLYHKVFTATFVKDNIAVTLTYIAKTCKIYVSVSEHLVLSEHLFQNEIQCQENPAGRKNTLHMLKMQEFGNSFAFQLKNGHFIVSDGGLSKDLEHLFTYLETLTDKGKKPVIEAWFISHGHTDHCGVFRTIVEQPAHADRVCVEGLYYNEPNDNVINLDPATRADIVYMKEAVRLLRTTAGEVPKIYRPQTGQRYYFDDIEVDIIVGQEQLSIKDYSGDFNDSSTWCMFTVDGQKCLLGGDGDRAGTDFILASYDPQDMKIDIFTLLHHGHNTKDRLTEFCSIQTVLVTNGGELPKYRAKENEHLRETSKEWLSWNKGTIVLEFPYQIGTSKIIEEER